MQKVNKYIKLLVFIVLAVAILSFTVAQSGVSKVTSLGGSTTPTFVASLDKQLVWDCPGCPN